MKLVNGVRDKIDLGPGKGPAPLFISSMFFVCFFARDYI